MCSVAAVLLLANSMADALGAGPREQIHAALGVSPWAGLLVWGLYLALLLGMVVVVTGELVEIAWKWFDRLSRVVAWVKDQRDHEG